MYHFTDGGLKNVWLANGYRLVGTPYGKGVAIEDVPGLTRAICRALVKKQGRLTGAEFRYLRLHLRLSQKELAKFFGNTEQSIANWEKGRTLPVWADRQVRLCWRAKEDGAEPIKKAMQRMGTIERLLDQRIVVEETSRGWRGRIEDI